MVYENQPELDVQQPPPSPLSPQPDGPGNQTATYTSLQGKGQDSENAYENDTELGYKAPQSPGQVVEYEYVNPARVL